MSYFLTKTIAQLLTPPTETASTSPAPTTERSGEELLSVLSDAVDVAAILSSTTAPTTELLSVVSAVAVSISSLPSPTFSSVPSWSPSFSNYAHIDCHLQSSSYHLCILKSQNKALFSTKILLLSYFF